MATISKQAPCNNGRFPADSFELDHCIEIIKDWCKWAKDKSDDARKTVKCDAGNQIRDYLYGEMIRLNWRNDNGYPFSCSQAYTLLNGILEKPDVYYSNLSEFEQHSRDVMIYRLESDAATAEKFKTGRKKGTKGGLHQAIYQLCSKDPSCCKLKNLLQFMRNNESDLSDLSPGKLTISEVDDDNEVIYYYLPPSGIEKKVNFHALRNILTKVKKEIPHKR